MNKYQEAFDKIDDYCYGHSINDSHKKLKNDFKLIQELIYTQNRYCWHDLRKDSNDLPKENGYVMAMFKGDTKPSIIYCLNSEFGEYIDFVHFELEGYPVETYFEFYDPDVDEVLAWKYIEEIADE